MVSKKDIVCIVVLYNPDKQVINNIKEYCHLFNRIVLVDNSEKDNNDIFAKILNAKYIPLKANTGIAKAINVGIENSDEPYILTMDQDSIISENLIDAYISFLNKMDSSDLGALTPQYDTDRNHIVSAEGYEKVLLSMQSGTLFKRKTFNKIGLFNEELFLDVVDWEFFLRMKEAHLNLIRLNNAVLKHQPAITKVIGFGPFKLKYGSASPIRYYYQVRNLLWTARKYHSKPLYANLFVKFLKIILLFDHKQTYLKSFRQGIRDANNNQLGKYYSNYEGN